MSLSPPPEPEPDYGNVGEKHRHGACGTLTQLLHIIERMSVAKRAADMTQCPHVRTAAMDERVEVFLLYAERVIVLAKGMETRLYADARAELDAAGGADAAP